MLCLSHSIEEHDQLKLLSGLGYDVASIGGYINPHAPHDPKRPALPEVPYFPEVQGAVDAQEVPDNLGAAQAHIPDAILDWLGKDGVIIYHHYLQRLFGQWDHLADWRAGGGRVIWRTVGQSVEANEREALPYREDGLEVIRYSPHEKFIPGFIGADALIRFYKDEDEWSGWTGEQAIVTNVTQEMVKRAVWTNAAFWWHATKDLPAAPAGPDSEALEGGLGMLEVETMQALLREARCYVYTGTQPASYTLGLIEAMMTGIPVFSIGPELMTMFPYGPQLFEGHRLAGQWSNNPEDARAWCQKMLDHWDAAHEISKATRMLAKLTFGRMVVGEAWKAYLG